MEKQLHIFSSNILIGIGKIMMCMFNCVIMQQS